MCFTIKTRKQDQTLIKKKKIGIDASPKPVKSNRNFKLVKIMITYDSQPTIINHHINILNMVNIE